MRPQPITSALALAGSALALAACGSSGSGSSQASAPPATQASVATQTATTETTTTATTTATTATTPKRKHSTTTTTTPPPSATAPKKTRKLPPRPGGKIYSSRVSNSDASRYGTTFRGGVWALLLGKAAWTISTPRRAFTGILKMSGGRATFSPVKGAAGAAPSALGPCGKSVGTYAYTQTPTTIVFTKLSDPCGVRTLLAGRKWLFFRAAPSS
jgi:hypothetical protein